MPNRLSIPALIAGNVILALALMWTAAQSQTPPQTHDVLRAKLIELVNDNGNVVGQLFLGEGGSGQIRLRNAAGEVRVKLGVANDGAGAGLIMMDATTEPAVILRAAAGGASLTLDGEVVAD
jgi:hypothetical protein